ncbi:rab-like protein 2A isoform X2 [Pyrgilauda ruficollis]|uniref:rab-like protein 2A isoform X2 n=1 Tax=Pyrgilauda ruficollis TaxID=221976 RepID=UPI001B873091|nr:rab-like protein 2A isoform X2 [Pyrgilauda ruficollis]
MATAAEEQGRAAAREEAPDGARDEAAAGAEETVKIICLGDSAVGKSKCVGRGRPAGCGGGSRGAGRAAAVARLTGRVLSPQAAGAVPARWLVSLAAGRRAGSAAGGVAARRLWPHGGSLARRSQPQQLSTFALTLYQHRARVGGQEVRVDFWDTAGQERFRSMHASYYHQAHACIMVFDVQRKVTYKNLNSWYKELREFRPEIPCIVVANKIDADMKVTQRSFNFARKFSLPFYFVSAADGTNVVKLFNDAIRLAVAYKQHSGDFMDEVLRELESFDLQNTSKDLSDKGKSCTEEESSSA